MFFRSVRRLVRGWHNTGSMNDPEQGRQLFEDFSGSPAGKDLLEPGREEALRRVYAAKPDRRDSETDFVTTWMLAVLDRR